MNKIEIYVNGKKEILSFDGLNIENPIIYKIGTNKNFFDNKEWFLGTIFEYKNNYFFSVVPMSKLKVINDNLFIFPKKTNLEGYKIIKKILDINNKISKLIIVNTKDEYLLYKYDRNYIHNIFSKKYYDGINLDYLYSNI